MESGTANSPENPQGNPLVTELKTVLSTQGFPGIQELSQKIEKSNNKEAKFRLAIFYSDLGVSTMAFQGPTEERIKILNAAVVNYAKALRLAPTTKLFNMNLALAYHELGKLKRDRTLIVKAINLFEKHMPFETFPAQYYQLGIFYLDLGDLPGGTAAHFVKGRTYFAKSIESGDVVSESYLMSGSAFSGQAFHFGVTQDLIEQAEAMFQKHISLQPTSGFGHYKIGEAYFELGKQTNLLAHFEKSHAALSKAESLGYRSHNLYDFWGNTLSKIARIKDFDREIFANALKKYDTAKAIEPANYLSYFNSGVVLYDLAIKENSEEQKLKEAIALLTTATQLQKNDADIHNHMGNALMFMALRRNNDRELLNDAKLQYELAVRLNPYRFHAYGNLANIHFLLAHRDGNFEEEFKLSARYQVMALKHSGPDLKIMAQALTFMREYEKYHIKELNQLAKLISKIFGQFKTSHPDFYAENAVYVEKLRHSHRL